MLYKYTSYLVIIFMMRDKSIILHPNVIYCCIVHIKFVELNISKGNSFVPIDLNQIVSSLLGRGIHESELINATKV